MASVSIAQPSWSLLGIKEYLNFLMTIIVQAEQETIEFVNHVELY